MSLFTYTEAAEISLRVAFSFLVLITLVGNSLVCLVVLRNRLMRSAMNYLLVNLACADMVSSLDISQFTRTNTPWGTPGTTSASS